MTDLNKEREALVAQIEVFKKETMELWFVPDLADTYKNKDLFSYSIMDGEVFFMREQARQLWSFWNKAKAQAVPEGYVLMPKVPTEKMFQAYERSSVAPMSTLSKTGYKAMVEAAGDQNENS
ncbi:hypothetical protein B9X50_15020 [Acinetobacter baumannii]|uniref:hypothetical protein n=1 Tax=Acinetobacter baumannii TaxID=470 RepID=UPI00044C12AD|nr:hypothetical protein [Acinetobacter baumannii]EHU1965815.1 hypothetical protein [Acinetobacter baumannii]EXH42728.1 hypothetical protein J651_2106 [Acinetobacter baumannii 1293320]MBF1880840.1 hypothetical protein [Acinetobacter baumannii]MDV4284557.1 hypothetical protein [Acinetobacter baumannii]OTM24353.1 hypothetical protein B9X50_15020 [Acinetobacter baumannii]